MKDAAEQLKTYNENELEYPHRIVRRRVKIDENKDNKQVEQIDENKKLTEEYETAPFRNMIVDSVEYGMDSAEDVVDRLTRAWSDDDCKWYCETYELIVPYNDFQDENRYYKDIWGNIRDKWGQIQEDEESSTDDDVEFDQNSFTEALTKYLKKENANCTKVDISKLSLNKNVLKIEAKSTYADNTNKDICIEMNLVSTNKAFTRYKVQENKNNKSNLSALVFTNKQNILECRYIIKK